MRWVLAELSAETPQWRERPSFREPTKRIRYWYGGWRDVESLGAHWHHEQVCCDDRECPRVFANVPRAAVESVRRACKSLAAAGQAELQLRDVLVPYYYWVPSEGRHYESAVDASRRKLHARRTLSVEERDAERDAQRLEREEWDRLLAGMASAIRGHLGPAVAS